MSSDAATYKAVWRAPRAQLELMADALTDILYPPADAVSLDKADAAEADDATSWSLHAYFTETPDEAQLRAAFDAAGIDDAPTAEIETLPATDWVAHALEGLGVVEAGRFVLFGRHDADRATKLDGIPLQIEANRAFGTGHHPTTAGCLEALTRLEPLAPGRVLDIGTGSGVLAIAARKLWPEADILATDNDPPSVEIAAENAALNGTEGIQFAEIAGVGDATRERAPFQLVLANILAEPLISLAKDVEGVLAKDGRVVLAGLLARQQESVVDAYAEAGLSVQDVLGDPVWPVLILGR